MKLLRSLAISITSIAFLLQAGIFAQNSVNKYTITEHIRLLVPANPVISPRGDKVVFTIKKPDLKESRWNTQVYLADVNKKKYFQLTPDGENSTNPQFSPDQKWITFHSQREYINLKTGLKESSAVQLWGVSTSGGSPVNWTSMPKDVEESIWSNDSKKIAILSDDYNEAVEKANKDNELKRINAVVFPKKNPEKVVSVLDAASKKIVAELKLDPGAKYIRFSPDGERIIYQTNYTGEFNDEQKYDIWSVDLKGIKTQITSSEGPETLPTYSPAEKKIAFISQTIPDIEFAETDICIMDTDGKNIVNLTDNFNYSVTGFIWKDSLTILFTVNEKTNENLYAIDIQSGKIERLIQGDQVLSNVSLSKDTKHICYKSENSQNLAEIFVDNRRITDFTGQLEQFELGSQEVITYRSRDNKFDIEAILFKPKDFDAAKKYPFILMLHGGPYGTARNILNQGNAARVFSEEGYVVLLPNPRGSAGYSSQFSMANRYDLGGGDYEDVMAGVDYIIAKGYIDETNMGVTGGSYGGYLTNWIVSQTDRFKAAVSMFGIFNFITDWSNSFQPAFEKMYFGYYYWEKPLDKDNLYLNRSPFFYVKNIKTPTLILQGEKDQYTDIANSREMYQVLHTLGTPVEFVLYPRAGHGIKSEPNQYIDSIERSLNWFNKYLKKKNSSIEAK